MISYQPLPHHLTPALPLCVQREDLERRARESGWLAVPTAQGTKPLAEFKEIKK